MTARKQIAWTKIWQSVLGIVIGGLSLTLIYSAIRLVGAADKIDDIYKKFEKYEDKMYESEKFQAVQKNINESFTNKFRDITNGKYAEWEKSFDNYNLKYGNNQQSKTFGN